MKSPQKPQEGKLFQPSSWYLTSHTSLIVNGVSSQDQKLDSPSKKWLKLTNSQWCQRGRTDRQCRQGHRACGICSADENGKPRRYGPTLSLHQAAPPCKLVCQARVEQPDQTQPPPASLGETASCSAMPTLWKLSSNKRGISCHTQQYSGPQEYDAQWKKIDTRGHIRHDSNYMKCSKRPICRDRVSGCLELWTGTGINCKWIWGPW